MMSYSLIGNLILVAIGNPHEIKAILFPEIVKLQCSNK